jgi:hypothetical protein
MAKHEGFRAPELKVTIGKKSFAYLLILLYPNTVHGSSHIKRNLSIHISRELTWAIAQEMRNGVFFGSGSMPFAVSKKPK